jgi:GNAT superfamily N-acetyltransferase
LLAHPDAVALPAREIEDGHVLVATEGELKTGFAAVELRDDGTAELDGLFVEPSRWREGIGSRLADAAAHLAAAAGREMLTVVASPAARDFYERCGFSRTGVAETRFGPAILMARRLRLREGGGSRT